MPLTTSQRELQYVITARDEASKTIQQVGKNVGGLNDKFSGLGKVVSGVGLQRFSRAGQNAIRALVVKAGEFEQVEVAFTTMLGSAEDARIKLEELTDFASRTPFTITGVRDAARALLAVGFEAEELIPTLKTVGDVSAGLGRGQEGLQRLILNLGQVRTQGKLTGRELRDFAVLGVPIIDELAKSLGVAKDQVSELVSAGAITDEIVVQAFKNMTSEGGKFFNLMDKQSETVLGRFSNLEDAIVKLQEKLGAPMAKVLTDLVNLLIPVVEKIGLLIEKNPQIAQFVTIMLGLGVAVTALAAPLLIVLGLFAAMGVALAPVGMIAVGIIGITGLITALILNWGELGAKAGIIIEVMNEKIRGLGAALKKWFLDVIEAAKVKLESLRKLFISITTAIRSALGFGGRESKQTGGIIQSPLTMVGEQGAELVSLPKGSRVFEAGLTRRMMERTSKTVNPTLNINAPMIGTVVVKDDADESRLAERIQESLAQLIRNTQLRAA